MRFRGVIFGVAVVIAVSTTIYLVNRYWIAPAAVHKTECDVSLPMAADFALTSLAGKHIQLKNYRGKVVLLNFWATWCGPCQMEIPGLERLQSKYGPQGFRVIGMDVISEDNASAVRKFYQQFKMNYPVALASDKLVDLYGGLFGTPTSILIGCDGRIYGKYFGYLDEGVFAHKIQGLLTACRRG